MSLQSKALALSVPQGSIDAYVQMINEIPVLTADEEMKLAKQYHDKEDLDAVRQLILSNLRFVVHVARGYSGYGLPQADLIQEGNLGLMKAVKRVDVLRISYSSHMVFFTGKERRRLASWPRTILIPWVRSLVSYIEKSWSKRTTTRLGMQAAIKGNTTW